MASDAALITGASARIGAAMAMHLAGKGYDIALHYGRSKDTAEKAAQKIREKGVSCELLQADLSDTDAVAGLVPKAVQAFPHLSVLINNASVFEAATIAETDPARLSRHLDINLGAPFMLSRDFAAAVDNGSIVNMVDERIIRNESAYAAYTLSKKSLMELTLMSARELAPYIRVNAIAPGFILPPAAGIDMEKALARIPLGRKGDEADILLALDYLLSADYVTGQILYVDGGSHV